MIGRLPAGLRAALRVAADRMPQVALNRAGGALARAVTRRGRNPRLGDKLAQALRRLGSTDLEDLFLHPSHHWRSGTGLLPGLTVPTSAFDTRATGLDPLTALTHLDACTYLPDDLEVKIDRASMAASLEARAPLLDHRIAEFAWSLPASFKLRDGRTKWLLRQVVRRSVPDALIDRPKQGFEPPVQDWLRGPLRDWADDLLSVARRSETGLLDPALVRDRWSEHRAGHRNWTYPLWTVLMLQAWRAAERG